MLSRWLLALAVVVSVFAGLPAASAAPRAADSPLCFTEVPYCISGRFRQYWEQNGGLQVFGLPKTTMRAELNRENGQNYQTQWFERARFELHPENNAPYDVLLGRLGADLRPNWYSDLLINGSAVRTPKDGCLWFSETQLNVCDQAAGSGFRRYWETHGLKISGLSRYQQSLALFGLPISDAQQETNAADGNRYLTQWFERARFEWHPDEPEPYVVLLGLLGNEIRAPLANAADPSGLLSYISSGDLYVKLLSNGQVRRVTNSGRASVVTWAADGLHFAFTQADGIYTGLVRLEYSQSNGLIFDAGSQGRIVALDLQKAPLGGMHWSPDGTKLAYTYNNKLVVVDADGSFPNELLTEGVSSAPAWSPDNLNIGVVYNQEIYRIRFVGSDMYRIVAGKADYSGLAWSPDGKKLAYTRNKDGVAVWTVKADGSGSEQIGDDTTRAITAGPFWSPDGKQVLFTRYTFATSKTDVIARYGQLSSEEYAGNYTAYGWSPNGEWALAATWQGNEDTEGPIYAFRADGSEALLLANGARPLWAAPK